METSKTGYQVQSYDVPVKRYCQTLDLRDSPELIAEYRKRHSQAEAWPGNSCRYPGSWHPGNGNLYPGNPTVYDRRNSP